MFVTDETVTSLSHVTFYRCSLCVSEHVSSEPVLAATSYETTSHFETSSSEQERYLMA